MAGVQGKKIAFSGPSEVEARYLAQPRNACSIVPIEKTNNENRPLLPNDAVVRIMPNNLVNMLNFEAIVSYTHDIPPSIIRRTGHGHPNFQK
jgi:hypothetical protein